MQLLHEWLKDVTWKEHPTVEIPSNGKGSGRIGVFYKKEATINQTEWMNKNYPNSQGKNICGEYWEVKIGWASFYGCGEYWVVALPPDAPKYPGHWDGFTPSGGPVENHTRVRRLLQRPRVKST